jgi:hypothetical protein
VWYICGLSVAVLGDNLVHHTSFSNRQQRGAHRKRRGDLIESRAQIAISREATAKAAQIKSMAWHGTEVVTVQRQQPPSRMAS